MDSNDVLIRPIITEKSSALRNSNFYSFLVHQDANKVEVKKAVSKLFGVTVVFCNIKVRKPKIKMLKNRRGYGKTSFQKVAIVKLAPGSKIKDLEV